MILKQVILRPETVDCLGDNLEEISVRMSYEKMKEIPGLISSGPTLKNIQFALVHHAK